MSHPAPSPAMIVEDAQWGGIWPQFGAAEQDGLTRVLHSNAWCRLKDADWRDGECGRFERELGAYLGAPHVLAVANGTVAIELGLTALGLQAGDEVLVQAGTFFGTVTPILKRGGVPVFVDFAAATCTVDPASLEARVGPRTKGVIVVPLCGLPPDMDKITDFCRRHGLWLLEDCAQAMGTTWNGRKLGTFGDIGTFSFQQDKPLQAGEGGAVVCRDAALLDRVFAYHQGFSVPGSPTPDRTLPGTNSRITPWQAAILRGQLTALDRLIDIRLDRLGHLLGQLTPDDPIRLVPTFPQVDRWSIYSVPFFYDASRTPGRTRDDFIARLRAAGVPATEGHVEPLYQRPLYRDNDLPHKFADCPVTEQITRDSYFSIMHWFFLGPRDWTSRLVAWMRHGATR